MRKIFLLSVAGLLATVALPLGCSHEKSMESVVDEALANAGRQVLVIAEKYASRDSLLPRTWENGQDISSDSRWWTSGFFPGTLWYVYENTGSPDVLEYARLYTSRVEREKYTTDNHDVGFMLYCSFGNGLRLTGEKQYEEVLLTGARSLATRFSPATGLIRSWDHSTDRWQYPVIIDNMMNLELLMWAAEYSGDNSLRDICISHADKTMEHHYRPDGSCWHVVSYDMETGLPHVKQTHQGYSDDSSWSRGQSWGLYGYTYMYRLTGYDRYLQQARKIAGFLLSHKNMPEDGIPYWDYDSPDIPDTPRDASAAALMASALIELSGYVEADESRRYLNFAERQVRSLASERYTAPVGTNGGFILMHSTGAFPLDSEIDVPLTYADYYYLEALTRLKRLYAEAGKAETCS
ncbi:MAG: glycoside hydrolase family 88 protein [Bacteroidales bacterium]|nr:glycoside hydrolase family 88 protein [Bacteroides sp.]MCM1199019.1 glycoside hydrolase family 88 protein [Clostridium sp.]MCM1502425.1 glycoside hydrolase family 88 protein [Bacteroidales bacterium]